MSDVMSRTAPVANGYLLVEALVAFAIVAIMSALVFDTLSQASRAVSLVNQRRDGMLLARSVLAAATVDSPSQPVARNGSEGDLAWTVSTESWQSDETGDTPWRKVTVTIATRGGNVQVARLSGLKAAQ